MAWFKRFSDPIVLPDGRELLTLRDAAEYITLTESRARCRRLASRDGNAVAGRRARRAGNAGADRDDESVEPARHESDTNTAAKAGQGQGSARQEMEVGAIK